MAYRFNNGGGGASNSTSWNSATVKETSKHGRLWQLGKVIGVSDSPFFPKTAAEYKKHVAEWAVQRHAAEKECMEHRIEDMEAERKTGVKVIKKAMCGLGPGDGINKSVSAPAGTTALQDLKTHAPPTSLNSVKDTKQRIPPASSVTKSIWETPTSPGVRGMWNHQTGNLSIWVAGAENHSSKIVAWPERDERKHYGEKRISDGLKRYLPPPLANQIDLSQVKWIIEHGIPRDVATQYLDMNPIDVPWELKKIMPGYELTIEVEEHFSKTQEEWNARGVKIQGDIKGNGLNEPPPGGWIFDEAKLQEIGDWSGLLNAINRSG